MAASGKPTIVGIGQTEFSKNSGRSELQLAAEAIKAALDDAGLKPADVDGLITFTLDGSDEVGVARCLGIDDLKYASRIPNGGAASVATIFHAMSAVASGTCETVVVWRAMNERSQYRFGQPMNRGAIPTGGGSTFMEWCLPFGAQSPASWEALTAQAYMSRYGVSNADFGLVSVLLRKHAATNPAAWFYGKPITLEDHQASRWIVAPALRLLDCCQESDGGVALVISSAERARDLRQKPVEIRGAVTSMRFDHEIVSDYYHSKDLTHLAISERVRDRLTHLTGIAPRDTNVAMIYDNFTPQIFLQLEAFGFCGKGEARDYIKAGNLELTGRSPLSPNGGHIGEGYIHGMNLITEGVRQARGTAANQVSNVENVFLASGIAGAIIGPA
jgi:acetyl-CoA acetyltransferase